MLPSSRVVIFANTFYNFRKFICKMDGHIVPAGPAPPGVSSNFIDPVNMAPNLVACNVALLVVSVLIVAARIVSRTVLTDWRLGWDDCNELLHL